jgi:hypothetical protein
MVAIPLLSVDVPITTAPSLNVTEPEDAAGETVALRVIDRPEIDGFGDEVSEVVVFARAAFTVCVSTDETLATSFASPP